MNGKHILANFFDFTDPAILTNLLFFVSLINEAIKISSVHLLHLHTNQWNIKESPDLGGISIIGLLEESHISLHTWPEFRYLSLDIYTCNIDASDKIYNHIKDTIISKIKDPQRIEEHKFLR
jgi:S-adenosylmethionine decarboxylase